MEINLIFKEDKNMENTDNANTEVAEGMEVSDGGKAIVAGIIGGSMILGAFAWEAGISRNQDRSSTEERTSQRESGRNRQRFCRMTAG
jgi:hypothetical protein